MEPSKLSEPPFSAHSITYSGLPKRDEMLWGFHKSLEAYLPSHKRVYGYFCLQILHKDRLVGRFDPKLERKTGTLILRALYLEPGVKLTEDLVNDIAKPCVILWLSTKPRNWSSSAANRRLLEKSLWPR